MGFGESSRQPNFCRLPVSGPVQGIGPAATDSLTITLNTTAPAWEVTWTGPSGAINYTYTTNPTITGVVLGESYGSEGTYSSFALTNVSVPEPSTYALLGLGAGALLLVTRRLRRSV